MAAEQFANNAQTTLNGAITAGATSLVVQSATGFPTSPQFRIVIDGEIMLVTNVSGTTWTVSPGTSVDGTTAASLANGAVVTQVPTAAVLSGLEAAIAPTGAVIGYAGSSAPSGWLLCDGTSYSTSTYSVLFGVIVYTYGGSGASFNVPDLRGRTIVGPDPSGINMPVNHPSLGSSTGGQETHTLVKGEIPNHQHTVLMHIDSTTVPGNPYYTSYSETGTWGLNSTGPNGGAAPDDGLTGTGAAQGLNGAAHNNVQPYLAINHIIKT